MITPYFIGVFPNRHAGRNPRGRLRTSLISGAIPALFLSFLQVINQFLRRDVRQGVDEVDQRINLFFLMAEEV